MLRREENRLAHALEANVPVVDGRVPHGFGRRDERLQSRGAGQGLQERLGAHARLVREVHAGVQRLEEPAREHGDLDAGCRTFRGARHQRLDAIGAVLAGLDASQAVRPRGACRGRRRLSQGRKLPRFDEGVGERLAGAIEEATEENDRLAGFREAHLLAVGPAQGLVEKRADGLRRRALHGYTPKGVDFAPLSTMSYRYPSASPSTLLSSASAQTRRLRPSPSGTLLYTGSSASSGSPGKYICVMRRCTGALPRSEKWMCAGRHANGWLSQG